VKNCLDSFDYELEVCTVLCLCVYRFTVVAVVDGCPYTRVRAGCKRDCRSGAAYLAWKSIIHNQQEQASELLLQRSDSVITVLSVLFCFLFFWSKLLQNKKMGTKDANSNYECIFLLVGGGLLTHRACHLRRLIDRFP